MRAIMTATTFAALSALLSFGCAGEETAEPAAKPVPAATKADTVQPPSARANSNTTAPPVVQGVPATNGGVEAKARLEAKKKAEAEAAANQEQGTE